MVSGSLKSGGIKVYKKWFADVSNELQAKYDKKPQISDIFLIYRR